MAKRFLVTVCAVIFAAPFSAHGKSEGFLGVQDDMVKQIEDAQQDLNAGQTAMALAHVDLVLMDRPLKIFVSCDSVGRRQQKDCERAIEAAIDLWNRGLDDGRQFERTDDVSTADIRLRFQPDVLDAGVPVGGLVTWRRAILLESGQPTDQTTADIQVRVHKPRGGWMSFELMRHEASHELGHVLGLEDSPRMGDIMSPLDLRHPVGKISEFELDAIRRMRGAAQAVKDEVLLAENAGV